MGVTKLVWEVVSEFALPLMVSACLVLGVLWWDKSTPKQTCTCQRSEVGK